MARQPKRLGKRAILGSAVLAVAGMVPGAAEGSGLCVRNAYDKPLLADHTYHIKAKAAVLTGDVNVDGQRMYDDLGETGEIVVFKSADCQVFTVKPGFDSSIHVARDPQTGREKRAFNSLVEKTREKMYSQNSATPSFRTQVWDAR